MSHFIKSENLEKHIVNMDYTTIQNMKTDAMDRDDMEAYDEAVALEIEWEKSQ